MPAAVGSGALSRGAECPGFECSAGGPRPASVGCWRPGQARGLCAAPAHASASVPGAGLVPTEGRELRDSVTNPCCAQSSWGRLCGSQPPVLMDTPRPRHRGAEGPVGSLCIGSGHRSGHRALVCAPMAEDAQLPTEFTVRASGGCRDARGRCSVSVLGKPRSPGCSRPPGTHPTAKPELRAQAVSATRSGFCSQGTRPLRFYTDVSGHCRPEARRPEHRRARAGGGGRSGACVRSSVNSAFLHISVLPDCRLIRRGPPTHRAHATQTADPMLSIPQGWLAMAVAVGPTGRMLVASVWSQLCTLPLLVPRAGHGRTVPRCSDGRGPPRSLLPATPSDGP